MGFYLPITPEQIADNEIGACEAGASMFHIHVRDLKIGQLSAEMDLYRQILTESKSDLIVVKTTGGGLGMSTTEERTKVVTTLKPEIASFNAGGVNMGLYEIPDQGKITQCKFRCKESYLRSTEDIDFAYIF
jgi:uncharacterized protein (DUF849 family)